MTFTELPTAAARSAGLELDAPPRATIGCVQLSTDLTLDEEGPALFARLPGVRLRLQKLALDGDELDLRTYATGRGYEPALAQTMALNTLVVLEIFHLFFIRNIYGTSLTWAAVRGTRVVWACVIAVTGAQFAITYAPPLQAVFGTQSVPLLDGLLIVAVGAAFFAIIEVEKQLRLALQRRS